MKYYISHSIKVERTISGFCRCEFFQRSPFRLPVWVERDPAVAVFTYLRTDGSIERVHPLVLRVSLEEDLRNDVLKYIRFATDRRRPHNIRVKLRA